MQRDSYYRHRLSSSKLLKCYQIAPPRIRQYLNAEIQFVMSHVQGAGLVLELGCGYGRAMKAVAPFVSTIVGNDISPESLELAKSYLKPHHNCRLTLMDASSMAFRSNIFDAVFCIQNGISAFGANQKQLVSEATRITKDNGLILFSSYSPKIWHERLNWFKKQSQAGLLGEIDDEKTRNGTIVCRDGFKATTVSPEQFKELFEKLGQEASIVEVDESSVFCKTIKK
jgi:ubiquinone/menaquinone biosynthesis C-methylase UbiE